MRTTYDTTEPNDGDGQTTLESRGLLVAVESAIIPEERPVVTTDVVTRHVYNVEDPSPLKSGLVGNTLARLSRHGFVGRDRIGGLDVWFAPNVEAFDDATSDRENDGEGDR